MRDTFVLRTEWYDSISDLPIKDKSEILDAIFLYNLDRESEIKLSTPLSKMCWNFIKPTIDYHNKRYLTSVENGKKGGAPKGNTNAKKQPKDNLNQPKKNLNQPKNNLTVTDTVIDTVIDTDIDTDIDIVIDSVIEKTNKKIEVSNKVETKEEIMKRLINEIELKQI